MFPFITRNLPHVDEKIFSYLGLRDLISSKSVCKEWFFFILKMDGNTKAVFQRAILSGHIHVVAMFLRANVDISINESMGSCGQTALCISIMQGRERILKLMLEREDVDINAIDTCGDTALILATRLGKGKIVELLLARKDIDINSADKNGLTPLMHAVKHGCVGLIKHILQHREMDINTQNKGGKTALIVASRYSQETAVKVLIGRSDIKVNALDEHVNTAMTTAAYWELSNYSLEDMTYSLMLLTKMGALH